MNFLGSPRREYRTSCTNFFSLYISRIPNNWTDRSLLWRSLLPFSTLYLCLFILWVLRFSVRTYSCIWTLVLNPCICLPFVIDISLLTLHLLRASVLNAAGIQCVLVPRASGFKICPLPGWTHHSWSQKRQFNYTQPFRIKDLST